MHQTGGLDPPRRVVRSSIERGDPVPDVAKVLQAARSR